MTRKGTGCAGILAALLLLPALVACGDSQQQRVTSTPPNSTLSGQESQYENPGSVTDLAVARDACNALERQVELGLIPAGEYLECVEKVLAASSDRNTGSPQAQYRDSDDWFEMYWKFQFYNALLGNAGIGYTPRYGYMGSTTVVVVPQRVVTRVRVPSSVTVDGRSISTQEARTNFNVSEASRNYNGMATAHRSGKTKLQYGKTPVTQSINRGRALSNTRKNTGRPTESAPKQAAPGGKPKGAVPSTQPSAQRPTAPRQSAPPPVTAPPATQRSASPRPSFSRPAPRPSFSRPAPRPSSSRRR